jgi:hypothetical protein
VKVICAAIADGLPNKYAAMLGGISADTFCEWQNRFPEFSEAVGRATARGIHARLKIINAAARKGDVRAAMWHLEHVFPEHFARNRIEMNGPIRVETCGPDGQPVKTENTNLNVSVPVVPKLMTNEVALSIFKRFSAAACPP